MAARVTFLLSAACIVLAVRADAAKQPAAAGNRAPAPLKDLGRDHKIRLVYFVPADREPTRDYAGKIEVLLTFVADIYRTGLHDNGCGSRGLDFEFDQAGRLRVHLVRGPKKAREYSGAPDYAFTTQWRSVLPEVEKALGSARKTVYVIFTEVYDAAPCKFEWAGGVALGTRLSTYGGAAMFSAWVLQDMFCATSVAGQMELLADRAPIRGRKAIGSRKPDSPRSEFIEDGFGAVAHELGHALGLPHDHRKDRNYIMGNGFRYLAANYLGARGKRPTVTFSPENARMLAHSPYLSETPDPTDKTAPAVMLTAPKRLPVGATSIRLAVRATDDKALAGLLCFCSHGDTVAWGRELTGTEADVSGTFSIAPARQGTITLLVSVIDEAGNIGKARAKIAVGEVPREAEK